MRTLQAIIFDLDGVITDTAEFHFLAWRKLAENLNIPFTREVNEKLKGISRKESLEMILELGRVQDNYSEQEKIELANEKNQYYKKLIDSITPENINPGILSFIQSAKQYGCKLGLASASRNAFFVMERLGIVTLFDRIVDVNEVKKGKPDPEIFLKAAEELMVSPENCIGIEDALAGVHAIKDAGMFAVAIGPRSGFDRADVVYENTRLMTFGDLMQQFNLS